MGELGWVENGKLEGERKCDWDVYSTLGGPLLPKNGSRRVV